MSDNTGYGGAMRPDDSAGEFNAMSFVISQILSRINTSTLVKIIDCTNDGALSPVGFVDVQPLVSQVDGQGNPVPHGVIYGVPYMRIQGGTNAVIIDPKTGDIGVAVFASRDISKVKSTKAQSLPGSGRKYDWADGIYIGGCLNAVPVQYVQFEDSGITIHSPQKVTINAPTVEINSTTATVNAANATINGTSAVDIASPATTVHGPLTVTGAITGSSGISVTGNAIVTGKINATDAIESSSSLKVAGVTLNVP